MSRSAAAARTREGEFLWLISLSDLMILLFVFFVALYSFANQKPQAAVDEVQNTLLQWALEHKLVNAIDIQKSPHGLVIEIREKILFEPGESRLKAESLAVLNLIARALHKIPAPYRIGIEGHTDDSGFRGSGAAENWELSVRRAVSVFKAMNLQPEERGRVAVTGFGPTSPIKPNRNALGQALAENQALNRRVTIRIY